MNKTTSIQFHKKNKLSFILEEKSKNMCKTTTIEKIDGLASKSNEFSSYSALQMIQLCDEMITNFQIRKDEWSDIGNWRLEEAKVFGTLSREITKPEEASEHANRQMSFVRQALSSVLYCFLSTCKESYEYEAGISKKKPELLEKERRVEMTDGSGKSYSIHGPISLKPYNLEFELHTIPTTTKEEEEEEEEKKEQNCSKIKSISKPVTVILGAGNQPQLTIFDILQRTMVHREVVLVKHHPLRPHLIDPYSIFLDPLIKRGFVDQVLDEGIPETTKMLSHECVSHVHVTGALATDKAIRATLGKSKPHLTEKEIDNMVSSELGAATPFILADGIYTDTEIIHSARTIAASKKLNGGCNCLDAQVIVLPKAWEQKDQFKEALYAELKRQPNEPTYYPGSRDRAVKMVERYTALGKDRVKTIESTEAIGVVSDTGDNVTVVECGSPNDPDFEGSAMRIEAFGPVLAIVELENDGSNKDDYLNSVAIPYVNNKENIFGSLSCGLITPTAYDSKKLDRAIESLEYGTVGVNTFNVFGWIAATKGAVWCAHPLAPSRESGSGFIGNQFRVSRPAKTVVRGSSIADTVLLDSAKPPPTILIDALYLMDCSSTTLMGIFRIFYLLTTSAIKKVLSSFMPTAV